MEIDSCEIGPLTIRFSFTTKFMVSLHYEGKVIETTSQELLPLLEEGAGMKQMADHCLEVQPSKRGLIIRKIKFYPKNKRTAVRLENGRETELVDYLKETIVIQEELNYSKRYMK